jgi:stress-induced morphogen
MVELILPVIKKKDKERSERLNELIELFKEKKDEEVTAETVSTLSEHVTHVKKIRASETMFRHGVITSLVSKFDELMVEVLEVSFERNPHWLSNPEKKMTYKEVLECESLESLKSEIVAKEIENLMRDSHLKQVKFVDDNLKLGIEDGFPLWKVFLEITERRNLFVHTGGVVSRSYLENCEKWKIELDPRIEEGSKLGVSDKYIQHALECFYEICVRIIQATTRRIFKESFKEADWELNNTSVALFNEDKWSLAERLFSYALRIPDNLRSGDEIQYYFRINLCIAKKFGGKNYKADLHKVDWAPLHPMYHFAVEVLEDRFDSAARLMRQSVVNEKIGEKNFSEWPLLRDFKNSKEFKDAYKEVYKREYVDVLMEETEKEIEAQPVERVND